MAELKVYGAPWCPDCKRSKKFLAEHRIPMDWIDIDQDRDGLAIVQLIQNGGRSIPTIVFPDGSHLIEPSNDELARKLGVRLEASREFYELVIIGGGPAGLAAALYAAREGISAIVVEKSGLGGQAGATKRIDNYPGFPEGIDGAALAERFIAQAKRYRVELVSGVGVTAIEPEVGNLVIRLGNGQELCAHAVLIATGSLYRLLGVPGEEGLTGAGVHYCATCDGPFYRGAEELLVIGGGNSALEEALFLTQFAKKVRIVSHGSALRASELVQSDVRRHPQIEIVLDTEIVAFNGAKKLEEVVARHRTSGEEERWHPAAAFVFVGLNPNTEFVRERVHLDARGFVTTDVTSGPRCQACSRLATCAPERPSSSALPSARGSRRSCRSAPSCSSNACSRHRPRPTCQPRHHALVAFGPGPPVPTEARPRIPVMPVTPAACAPSGASCWECRQ